MPSGLKKALCIITAGLISLSVSAESWPQYSIQYDVKRDGKTRGQAQRTLTQSDSGLYELTADFTASILFYEIKRRETSRFSLSGDATLPLIYRMTDDRTFKDKKVTEFTFDYKKGVVKTNGKDAPVPFALSDHVFDPLLVYDVLIEKVREGLRDDISLRVFDDGKIEAFDFIFEGEESVSTPMGDVNTLHFTRIRKSSTRRTSMWLSPEYQYLPVQLEQQKEGEEQARLVATKVSMGK